MTNGCRSEDGASRIGNCAHVVDGCRVPNPVLRAAVKRPSIDTNVDSRSRPARYERAGNSSALKQAWETGDEMTRPAHVPATLAVDHDAAADPRSELTRRAGQASAHGDGKILLFWRSL